MAKFRYRMQNILNMKEKIEEQQKNNYSQSILQLQLEEEKYQDMVWRQEDAQKELKTCMLQTMDVMTIREKEDAVEIIKMYKVQQSFVVLEKQQDVMKAREQLNEAMKERKIYEKLREKAMDEFLLEEALKERKEVDELVSYRYGMKKSEE